MMRPKIEKSLRKNAALLAFVLLAFFGAIAINSSAHHTARGSAQVVYHSQYKACLRGNDLRREVNRRVATVAIQSQVLIAFMTAARDTRQASYNITHHQNDIKAVRKYQRLINLVRKEVHYSSVPIVNCTVAVPRP